MTRTARVTALLTLAALLPVAVLAAEPAVPLTRVRAAPSRDGAQPLIDPRALVRTTGGSYARTGDAMGNRAPLRSSGDAAGDLATLQRFVESIYARDPDHAPPAAVDAGRAKDAAEFAKGIP